MKYFSFKGGCGVHVCHMYWGILKKEVTSVTDTDFGDLGDLGDLLSGDLIFKMFIPLRD